MALTAPFRDRAAAGRALAEALGDRGTPVEVVVGLPRGGVPVAAEVARALELPLDVLVVRKLGVPQHPELAMGAIGEGGAEVVDDVLRRRFGVGDTALDRVRRDQQAELDRRLGRYRDVRGAEPLEGRRVLVVDDGIATGATMFAAIEVARARGATEVHVAVPIGSPRAEADLADRADSALVLEAPPGFSAVGQGYVTFGQTSDDEVLALLAGDAD